MNNPSKTTAPNPQQVKQLGRAAIIAHNFFDRFRSRAKQEQKKAKAANSQAKEMAELIDTAHEVLLEVSSVFPFMMFPDSLRVDRQKVVIIHRKFFGVAEIINIQVHELQAIEVDIGPFFGSVSITTQQYSNTISKVTMLSRDDAIRAQALLEGFVIANRKKLDYSNIPKDELVNMLEALGRGGED